MRLFILTMIALFYCTLLKAQVGIGTTTPHSSSQLDVNSNNKGFLPPRLTTTERNNIVSPTPGLMIFNLTTNKLEVYTAYGWGGIDISLPKFKGLLGTTNNDYANAVRPVVGGGYIIVAYTYGNNDGTLTGINSIGLQDVWIIRLSSEGTIIWQKLFGGTGNDEAYDIEQSTDGGFLVVGKPSGVPGLAAGYGGDDGWVFKIDADGNMLWQKRFGGAGTDALRRIYTTADGGCIVAGNCNSIDGTLTGVPAYGLQDAWLLKLDASGNIQWQNRYGGNNHEFTQSVQQLSDGNFILAGHSLSTNTGSFTGLVSNGSHDVFLLKVSNAGNTIWQKFYGGAATENTSAVRQTADGGFIITAFTSSSNTGTLTGITGNGSTDVYVIKTDASGNAIWQKLFGGATDDYGYFGNQTTDGGYIISGYSTSSNTGNLAGITSNGSADVYIIKLSALGNIEWQKLHGGTSTDVSLDIRQNIDGGYIVAGYSSSSNSGTLTGILNNGMVDVLVLKLNNLGNLE